MIEHDPLEDDPEFRKPLEETIARVEAGLDPLFVRFGACHVIWRETKRILKSEHGIDWRTPAEMNPGVLFD